MAKVIQLERNGDLRAFCRPRVLRRLTRHHHNRSESPKPSFTTTVTSQWNGASVPALTGPHSFRPWTYALRSLVHPSDLLN